MQIGVMITGRPETDFITEFQKVKDACGFDERAAKLIAGLKEKGYRLILATNPLFPQIATYSHVRWAGLNPEDFDWITDYTNSCTCKPNPAYYLEIAEKFSLDPKKCLMIGNNAQEDVEAAGAVGMSNYLVTDWLICKGEKPNCPQGSFADLIEYLKNI